MEESLIEPSETKDLQDQMKIVEHETLTQQVIHEITASTYCTFDLTKSSILNSRVVTPAKLKITDKQVREKVIKASSVTGTSLQ